MFQVGDKIVHPMHGAGVIDSIVQKKINGVVRDYYILKLPVGGMMVMIPTANSAEIGVRPVVKKDEADQVIAAMPDIEVDMTQNWNRRYRENMLRLKSGDLIEVARVASRPESERCFIPPSRSSYRRSCSRKMPVMRM